MYFCRPFHNGRNIINTAKSEIVRCFIAKSSSVFRYFALGENAQFACNSDANLVNREASLYFLKLVLFCPYLASACVKKFLFFDH